MVWVFINKLLLGYRYCDSRIHSITLVWWFNHILCLLWWYNLAQNFGMLRLLLINSRYSGEQYFEPIWSKTWELNLTHCIHVIRYIILQISWIIACCMSINSYNVFFSFTKKTDKICKLIEIGIMPESYPRFVGPPPSSIFRDFFWTFSSFPAKSTYEMKHNLIATIHMGSFLSHFDTLILSFKTFLITVTFSCFRNCIAWNLNWNSN